MQGKSKKKNEYKTSARAKLVVKSGYRIVGNMRDQLSDELGDNPDNQTCKLPNAMLCVNC